MTADPNNGSACNENKLFFSRFLAALTRMQGIYYLQLISTLRPWAMLLPMGILWQFRSLF